jgi:hypothetical protein
MAGCNLIKHDFAGLFTVKQTFERRKNHCPAVHTPTRGWHAIVFFSQPEINGEITRVSRVTNQEAERKKRCCLSLTVSFKRPNLTTVPHNSKSLFAAQRHCDRAADHKEREQRKLPSPFDCIVRTETQQYHIAESEGDDCPRH